MSVEEAAVMPWTQEVEVPLGARMEQHRPDLLAVARSILLDDDEAQDVVQATLEIALRHAHELKSPGALLPWLLRIETREAYRIARRARRFVRIGWRPLPEARGRPTSTSSLDVREALARLPARIRAAVVLHYMADLSVADTAAALGVAENTVKSELKRGLVLLREDLRNER